MLELLEDLQRRLQERAIRERLLTLGLPCFS